MSRIRFAVVAGVAALLPAAAWAHAGAAAHAHSALDGLLHPLTGLDHLLAMTLVGVWAVQEKRLLSPLAFVTGMAVGLFAGGSLAAIWPVEFAVGLSVVVLGLLAALALRLPAWMSVTVLGAAGLVHGAAHASEAPDAGFELFALGALVMTATLHTTALMLARWALNARPMAVRLAGASAAAAGVIMLAI